MASLADIDPATVPWFSLDGLKTPARVVSVTDGDTAVLLIPLRLSCQEHASSFHKIRARLAGIDTCELRSHHPLLRAHAERARELLNELVCDKVVDIECGPFDKYGRVLTKLQVSSTPDGTHLDVASYLVKSGVAFKYDGKGSRMTEGEQLEILYNTK
jgi:endonuclease YncB( thermonuclease family)